MPDVLRDRGDARHNVALVGMVSDLTAALDQVNSQVLVSKVQEQHRQGPDAERYLFFLYSHYLNSAPGLRLRVQG